MLLENEIYFGQIAAATDRIVDHAEALSHKSVLVTGASGMLGSCLIDMLFYMNDQYHFQMQIYAAGRKEEKIRRRFGGYCDRDDFYFVELDVCEESALCLSADYVIHAASNADPLLFASDPVGTFLANVTGTRCMLDLARQGKSRRVLVLSSGEMYGQPDTTVDAEGFREDYCGYVNYRDARACYPSGKRAAEVLCQSYIQQYGLDVVIARPCHCYGPTMTDSDSRALSQFFRKAVNGEDIVLKSTGEMVRSHCYVVDAAAALFKVLVDGQCGEAYNIADPDSVSSIRRTAELIAREAGQAVCFDLPDEMERRGYSKVSRAVLNPGKILALGWAPQTKIEQGVHDTIQILLDEKRVL